MNRSQLIAEIYWVGLLSTVAGWAAIMVLKKVVFKQKVNIADVM